MVLKRKVEAKGRINIPKDVLEQVNINPGEDVYIDISNNKIIIWKSKKEV